MKHKTNPDDVPGFVNKLNEARGKCPLRDYEIATICDRERKTVARWLKGETFPDVKTLRQLCLLFDVSADWLLGLDTAKDSDVWNVSAFE